MSGGAYFQPLGTLKEQKELAKRQYATQIAIEEAHQRHLEDVAILEWL